MYVNLYPRKQLRKTKQSFRYIGAFLLFGGSFALIRELYLEELLRPYWASASLVLVVAGALLFAVGSDKIRLNDAYFSLNPERVSFRLAPLDRERVLFWRDVESVEVSEWLVVFLVKQNKQVKMRLGSLQQPEVALHVARSVQLAAIEKNLVVNGILPNPAKPAHYI